MIVEFLVGFWPEMSDGFVTVAQCVEGLPLGTFVWEALFCAFLAWFALGAINESSPVAFSLVSTEWAPTDDHATSMAAALAMGNFLSIIASGWVADKAGRLALIRPALVLTVANGMLLQSAGTFEQGLVARFMLGLVTGGLVSVVPPLIAEILPSKHRGFYLTIWCCGWPAGSLFAVSLATMLPGLDWRAFYTLMLFPALVLYVFIKADMLLESPRYLYLAGRRDEGYRTLVDMYDKENIALPWAPETIAVTCAPPRSNVLRFGSSHTAVTLLLALTMFCASSAAQSMKLWMPTLLTAHKADIENGLSREVGSMMSFARGPKALSFLSSVRAPWMMEQPNYQAVTLLIQAYAVEFVGVILCAIISVQTCRKGMVQIALVFAPILALLSLAAAGVGCFDLCGPIIGMMLAAQSTALNFLQVFTAEHFPTSSRARTAAFVNVAAHFGNLTMPMLGGIVVQRISASASVLFFAGLFVLGLGCSMGLPLPTGREKPLHDIDDPSAQTADSVRGRKLDWPSYASI